MDSTLEATGYAVHNSKFEWVAWSANRATALRWANYKTRSTLDLHCVRPVNKMDAQILNLDEPAKELVS